MSEIRVDTISEKTSANGVSIDGVTLKDGAITSTAASTITTTGNENTLTLSSTDADANPGPVLNYYRNSGSAADNDYIGRNIFTFNNDAPEIETALAQNVIMTDVSNGSEDVKYIHEQMTAGSIVDRFSISATEAVFNEGSIDSDFRVESNGNANMLFVNGGDDDVRIGTGTSFGNNYAGLKLNGGLTVGQFSGDSLGGNIMFVKSRNTTIGSQTIVADDDEIGRISFKADDGDDTSYNNNVAAIVCQIDATPGTNDTAGRLIFETASDGARVNTERMRINSSGNVGIGTSSPVSKLTVAGQITATGGAVSAPTYSFDNDTNTGMTRPTTDSVSLVTGGGEGLRVSQYAKLSTNGESASDTGEGGLCLNQAANDDRILTFKSSDVSHGMSGAVQVDTYGTFGKAGGADGGLRIMGFCDGSADVMQIMGFGATAQSTDTTSSGAMVELFGAKKSGTGLADLAASENLVAFRQYGGTTRFIMKSDGTVHASDTSWATSLDTYDDAQLCRSMDMLPTESTREGFISDKWTEMVKYNINDLVEAGIYTEDGKDMIKKGETPFFRVQPLLRLHNGAIWQNYTKVQNLTTAMYKLAKEVVGEDKANEILEQNDIKLLN